MGFYLYLTLIGTTWDAYGPHFTGTKGTNKHIVYFEFENGWDDADLFCDDIEDINRCCNSILSYGDIEYFNSEKCKNLIAWINARQNKMISPKYREILSVLADFCRRAIDLNTGVYIDL